jgi:hypothetical protein
MAQKRPEDFDGVLDIKRFVSRITALYVIDSGTTTSE